MKIFLLSGLFVFALVLIFTINMSAHTESEQENVFLKMNRDLEEWNLSRLATVQSNRESKLSDFISDGCSGGLSEAWISFSKVFPQFKQHFGNKPPWETCCVSHDREYWLGDTEDGFGKRLQADILLSQCVLEYGTQNSKRLALKFNLSEEQIVTQFKITSELMYRAVRLGGQPCSYLPWRWGYGWPNCSLTKNTN